MSRELATAHNEAMMSQEDSESNWPIPLPEKQTPDTETTEWTENLSPKDLVTIHVTNTFPDKKTIRSHTGWEEKTGKTGAVRDTVHFTLNHTVVESHGGMDEKERGNWTQRNFVVLSPFEKIDRTQIKNMLPEDTFIVGDFQIPNGSHILVDWQSLPKLREEEIIDDKTMKEYTQVLIDTKNSTDKEITMEKDGVTYIICDLGKGNLRTRIVQEMKEMNYKVQENDNLFEGIPYEKFCQKYGLTTEMKLHEHNDEIQSENIGTRISFLNDTGLFLKLISLVKLSEKATTKPEKENLHSKKYIILNILEETKEIQSMIEKLPEEYRTKKQLEKRFPSELKLTEWSLINLAQKINDPEIKEELLKIAEQIANLKTEKYPEGETDFDYVINKLDRNFQYYFVNKIANLFYKPQKSNFDFLEVPIEELKFFIQRTVGMKNIPEIPKGGQTKLDKLFKRFKQAINLTADKEWSDSQISEGLKGVANLIE